VNIFWNNFAYQDKLNMQKFMLHSVRFKAVTSGVRGTQIDQTRGIQKFNRIFHHSRYSGFGSDEQQFSLQRENTH